MAKSQLEEKLAVESGYWPLYRYNPSMPEGERFKWESKDPKGSFQDFIRSERRYTALEKTNPSEAESLFKLAEEDAAKRMAFYKKIGEIM
jgi:pyruvate-ferredoxin/flavodoxin oxidoreductase